MAKKGPRKAHGEGLTFLQTADMFGTEAAAVAWITEKRWPDGPFCPKCGSFNVQADIAHRSMTHRCRDCNTGKSRTMFTLKMGTIMEGSKLPHRIWAIGLYLFTTNIKGISSMRLHRELGITQKSAWFMLHRLRKAAENGQGFFSGPAEVDEIVKKQRNYSKLQHSIPIESFIMPPQSGGGENMIAVAAKTFPTSRIPVVNVAEVPQRSPLRYPGGKTWLVPHIREWLRRTKPDILIEPFAGGAIVSLTAVMEDLVSTAMMIEVDRDVAAFWHSAILHGTTLQDRIKQFEPTIESVREMERNIPATVAEHGFRTLVLNRTRRGGILARGASFSKQGENGRGLLSRWYPETLVTRINAIQEYNDRLVFLEGNGMKILPLMLQGWGRRAAVFADPPYTARGGKRAGARLYEHTTIDHAALFAVLAEHDANFLMTYDAAPEIVDLVHAYNFDAVGLSMKNTHHNQLLELVITSEALFA